MMARPTLCHVLQAFALVALVSCENQNGSSAGKNYLDTEIVELHSLGLLGASAHPLTQDLAILIDDQEHHPGGVVVAQIDDSSPLSQQLEIGDVIVRVGETFLPNKEDPTLDFFRLLEESITDESSEVTLGAWRQGRLMDVQWSPGVPSLNEGLPKMPRRFEWAIDGALSYLSRVQNEDGSFSGAKDTQSAKVTITSFAGAAYVSGGIVRDQGPHHEALDKCFHFVRNAAENPKGLTPFAVSSALFFFAQFIEGFPDPEVMTSMGQMLKSLSESQTESGGWAALDEDLSSKELGDNEVTLATNLALLALGSLERCGVQGENELIERACAFIKSRTNGGSVITKLDSKFDRRSESGRSAGAAVALISLGCSLSDPFLGDLVDYHRKHLTELPSGPTAVPFHLMNAAWLHRLLGPSSWDSFFYECRYRLISLQRSDGSFDSIPGSTSKHWNVESTVNGPAWRTALAAITLGTPNQELAHFKVPSPMMTRIRNSDGMIQESNASSSEAPEGGMPNGQTMQFNSLEEAQEFLKSMGIDPDQIQSGGPIKMEKKKKDDD